MPMIPIASIAEGRNARLIAASDLAEEGLRRSIAAVGVLQPVLVRPIPTDGDLECEIVLGFRRFRAAKSLGFDRINAEIRVLTDAEVSQAQMAENIQRADMHAVDQWREVHAMIQDHGLTFEKAGEALGLDDRVMRRMELLGRLHPTFLHLCGVEMPSSYVLRKIAGAPAKTQARVAAGKGLVRQESGRETVLWMDIVNRCQVQRISRAVAIFDTASVKGIGWDEDLFAEPGSDDQFTTLDVDAFIRRQTQALRDRVKALAPKRHQVATMKDAFTIDLPHGFKEVHGGNPQRLKAHETAFHGVRADGSIIVAVAVDTKARSAAEKKAAVKAAAAPAQQTEATAATDDGGVNPDTDEVTDPAKPSFTKKGLTLLAHAKTDAVRAALEQRPMTPGFALILLVLALAADNVATGGQAFGDLAARVLAPGGILLDLSEAEIVAIAQTAIGRILRFDHPDARRPHPPWDWKSTSGAAAEWIGAAIAADTALPRFDTEAFLETASLAELKRAAAETGLLVGGTAKTLRECLIGRAPGYRPASAVFGAPAPVVAIRDDADV